MPQDNVELDIGPGLVSGDVYVDYAHNQITGAGLNGAGLTVMVAGQKIPLVNLFLNKNSAGDYFITGDTGGTTPVASVNLAYQLANMPTNSTTPTSVTTTAVINNLPVTATSETVLSTTLCFTSGTMISTDLGSVAVEDLAVGDQVVTASGGCRPVRWIGHREVDCASHPLPFEVWPVRISAGAFGADLPERDLCLSPGHPVLVGADEDGTGGHLVPIMCLINGTTIERMEVPSVSYWHVELDQHDILLAEGLPAESFLDYGSRPWFGRDAEAHALANPDFIAPGLGARCRPVAIDGAVVEAERRRLNAVFAMSLSAPCEWPKMDGMAIHLG